MKILLTGAAGFIGSHVAKRLIAEGHQIVGLDNINDYYDVNLKYDRLKTLGIDKINIHSNQLVKSSSSNNFSFVQASLEDGEFIDELFAEQQFDVVCNLAAQAGVRYSIEKPLKYIQSNVIGFTNILEACKNYKIKHLVYASSSSVYGLNSDIPFKVSHHTDHPVSVYAATKKSNEMLAHVYSHIYKLPTTGLRFFTVYGPWGRPDMAYFLFTDAILKGRPIKVFNGGEMRRDFTYIDDITEGVCKILPHPSSPSNKYDTGNPNPSISNVPFRIYNIGNNSPVTLGEFISSIEEQLGVEAKKQMEPMQPGDVTVTYADVEDITEDFGYRPSTPLRKGMEQFIKWYKEYYKVPVSQA